MFADILHEQTSLIPTQGMFLADTPKPILAKLSVKLKDWDSVIGVEHWRIVRDGAPMQTE